MSLYNHLHKMVFRLKDLKDGSGIYSLLAQLKREQFLPYDKIVDLQSARLRNLLQQAQSHSPYYQSLFEKHNIEISDAFDVLQLKLLPLLQRQDLQNELDKILCNNVQDPFLDSSGGSTGHPVNFYHDDRYRNHGQASSLLFLSWIGVRPGDKTAIFWGADREFKDLSRYDRLMLKINRIKQLNSFSMSEQLIEQFLNEINRFKPRYVYGYASSLYLVARHINQTRPLSFTPAAVRSSAEMLYDFQREEIERAFQAQVYNFYGSREVNNIAAECPTHEGLHVFASTRIVEIVNDNGTPVADGTPGNIAVTDLTNYAFPFIRYVTGDMAVKKSSPCSCRRGYPLLERIQGRSSDMIVINGKYIHGEFFTHLFYGKPEIAQFQLIQEDERHLKLLVVSREKQARLDDILAAIHRKVGDEVSIAVEFTDNIPPAPSGKYRFTVSRLREAR
jgi:phenylacetate-CoA ligase